MFDFLSKKIGKKKDLKQESAASRMANGQFTLKTFADQLNMINKMGSIQKIARFIPGVPKVSPEMMEKGKQEIEKFKSIISSMTEEELLNPQILNSQRKLRIAKESGMQISDIDLLIQRFEETKQFAKMFKSVGSKF